MAVGELEITPNEFWKLTPAEFYFMVEGYTRKQTRRRNELIYLAWHTEAFARMRGALPDLKTLLAEPGKERKQQTDEDMMAMCRMLNAAFGGDFVEV